MFNRNFSYGVDVGWMIQLESQGITWKSLSGEAVDPLKELKNMGATDVRLRVFVNPPESGFWYKEKRSFGEFEVGDENVMLGFCDPQSVLEAAKRVKENEMDLMLDFHYSDHFADPMFQDIPKEWENDTFERLKERVYDHTKEVLLLLKENAIEPKWVQIGNEIDNGLLLPIGSRKEHPENFVALLNEGYRAVKEVLPECLVIIHSNSGTDVDRCENFFDLFFKHGGKTDVLGFSYYPYWMKMLHDPEKLHKDMKYLAEKYQKPLALVEIGGLEDEEDATYTLLKSSIEAIRSLPDGKGLGIFYWEPEVGAGVLPDHYPLGASKALNKNCIQFTRIMKAYRDSKEEKRSE